MQQVTHSGDFRDAKPLLMVIILCLIYKLYDFLIFMPGGQKKMGMFVLFWNH